MSDALLPPDDQDEEFELYDFEFSVDQSARADDGTYVIHAAGEHEDRPVGLELRLGPDWEAQQVDGLAISWGKLEVVSLGAASDFLLETLDACFETELGARQMAARTPFIAASLEGDPRRPEAGPLRLKLFHEPEDDQTEGEETDPHYAEFFLHIDLTAGIVELSEKDPDFRTPLVLSLMSPGSIH